MALVIEGNGNSGDWNGSLFPGVDVRPIVIEADTTVGRLLEKRGGAGGYMVIYEVDDLDVRLSHLGASDVVRHKIVQDIVEAYRVFGEQRARADG